MRFSKPIAITILVILCLINFSLGAFHSYPELSLKLNTLSLSSGHRYFNRLSLWYFYARKGDWSAAKTLESSLDLADIYSYKSTHEPTELKKYINSLTMKPDKNVEDWLELSRVQYLLGKTDSAGKSLLQAKSLDPIRDDISQMYFQLYR